MMQQLVCGSATYLVGTTAGVEAVVGLVANGGPRGTSLLRVEGDRKSVV